MSDQSMPISQLIQRLTKISEAEGDLPVYFYDGEYEDVPINGVTIEKDKWSFYLGRRIEGKYVRIDNDPSL